MRKQHILTSLLRILALTCCLGLSACATISSLSIPGEPSQEYIDGLLEKQEFDTALKAVDKWQVLYPNNPELPKQRKKITQAISRFESNMLKKAKQLDARGQWQEAMATYETALATLPASQPLQNAYSDFSVRRLEHINALKEELVIAQAKHWLAIKDNIAAVYEAAANDHEARTWKHNSDAERERLARKLIEFGLAYEDNNHFGTAALRYDLAYRLAPGEFTKPYHERAAQTFAQRQATQSKLAKKDQQRQQSRFNQLTEEFDSHLANNDFSKAEKALNAMEDIDPDSAKLRERRNRLDTQRSAALENAILAGKEFYTRGEFESAINAWEQALKLDPDNKEVKENIQRAEKFRENLERLKQGS